MMLFGSMVVQSIASPTSAQLADCVEVFDFGSCSLTMKPECCQL